MLDADRPSDLLTVAKQLTFLQLDPTAVVAPSADLVAWTRIGTGYEAAELERAVERDRTLFEHLAQPSHVEPAIAMVRPMGDLTLFLDDMANWDSGGSRRLEWLQANEAFRLRVLEQLSASGPLASRDIRDTAEVSWESTGWTKDRNVTRMLEFLLGRGEVAVAGRRGRQRLWDVAERVYPSNLQPIPREEALRIRNEMRLRSLGVARPRIVGDAGVPAEIDGTQGLWRLDPAASASDFVGRTAILSPFDRLIHDRVRTEELFGFEYTLEMYKPKDKRRWGYFALPVLHHEQLVGKIDATADHKASQLVVHTVHQDVPFTRTIAKAIDAELEALTSWLGLDEIYRSWD